MESDDDAEGKDYQKTSAFDGVVSLSKYLTDENSRHSVLSNRRQHDDDVVDSPLRACPTRTYQSEYETLQSIGKGAYGYVKLARRKRDGVVVVVKSIKKSKINVPSCWLRDEKLERDKGLARVPLEVRVG